MGILEKKVSVLTGLLGFRTGMVTTSRGQTHLSTPRISLTSPNFQRILNEEHQLEPLAWKSVVNVGSD